MTKHPQFTAMRKLAKRGRKLTELISGAQRQDWLEERREIIQELHDDHHLTIRAVAKEIGISSSRVEQEYKKGQK